MNLVVGDINHVYLVIRQNIYRFDHKAKLAAHRRRHLVPLRHADQFTGGRNLARADFTIARGLREYRRAQGLILRLERFGHIQFREI